MPGEPTVLVSDPHGRARSFVAALARFPTEPRWAIIGGFAVYVRITDIHRFTHDLDTLCRNQPSLVEILVADAGAERLAAAKLQLGEGSDAVVIDVMADTADQPATTLKPDTIWRSGSAPRGTSAPIEPTTRSQACWRGVQRGVLTVPRQTSASLMGVHNRPGRSRATIRATFRAVPPE